MGMAIYYLKTRFPNETAAQEAFPKIVDFLEQMAKAKKDWQTLLQQSDQPVSELYEILKTRHADVFDRLKIIAPSAEEPAQDCVLDFLAGQLNSPVEDPDCQIWQNGKMIGFHGLIWHFADWSALARAMKTFGAFRAAWISDENIDPYQVLRV